MSNDWPVKPLSEVIGLRRGFDLPNALRVDGPYPILSAGAQIGAHEEAKVRGPGFAVGRATNLGVPQWSDTDFWPLNTTLYAEDYKGNDPRWLYRLFQTLDLSGFDSGSVQPMLNRNYIALVPVAVPPFEVQVAIAEVLGALDDKITANRRLILTADQLVETLVTSSLSLIQPLCGAIDFVFGEAFKGAEFSAPGTGRPLIRIRDLKNQRCQVWTTESRARERVVNPGEILVGMDAEFRATRWSGPQGVLNQRVLLAESDRLGPAVVRHVLAAPLAEIERSKTGTTVIHLNKADLMSAQAKLPRDEVVAGLRAAVDPQWARMVAGERENEALAKTRDELLPLLMSGKITVRDAEKTVEGVV